MHRRLKPVDCFLFKPDQVIEGASQYVKAGCDVVMAIGGGSPMDAAKGIAMVASNGGTVQDYEGANRIERPLPPMVFILSTAGSGAAICPWLPKTAEPFKRT